MAGYVDTTITIEVDGKAYTAPVDTPEFLDFWNRNDRRIEEFKAYRDYSDEQIDAMSEEETKGVLDDSVKMCAELVVALFGTETAQEIFNGKERSYTFCLWLHSVIWEQFNDDLYARLVEATSRYSPDNVQGD